MTSLDKIRISKVEGVTLWRRGVRFEGTLHLTQHHLIFSYLPPPDALQKQSHPTTSRPREVWMTYPMISFCTYRPTTVASHAQPSIRLRCRDFTFVAFHFLQESRARDAYETIRNLTCRLGKLERLYAFSYMKQGPEKAVNGWTVYNPMEEWRRLGVGVGSNGKEPDGGNKVEGKGGRRAWRVSKINCDYQYSPTYPALLPVPASISDNVLNYAGRYRSRVRIPVLTYLHPVNDCSITRSSQPLVGVRQNRSVQDEKLLSAIFSTSKAPPGSLDTITPEEIEDEVFDTATGLKTPHLSPQRSSASLEAVEDETITKAGRQSQPQEDNEEQGPRIYGAQQRNLIVDARPTVNAFAMQAVGMGSENMDHYPFATKAYLGIDNIHVMRDSLYKIVEALKESDVTPLPPNREQLAKSGWLKHISNTLDGAGLIARQVGIHHSHVLIHCSDGWDRTGQLSALSQLCLDPYYRTLKGFIVLVEKDFVSFGHQFRYRSGFLGSEKWFEVENERGSSNRSVSGDSPFGGVRGGGNALENALLSAKGFFNKHNESRESLVDPDGEMQPFDSPSSTGTSSPAKVGKGEAGNEKPGTGTKVKETSPVFHQFLDATYQLLYQHPNRFEFNERFLRRLLYHLYSCQYGTFLYDSEKQRVEARISERTSSVWDYFLARKEQFLNENYDGGIVDDNTRGKERLIFPDCKKVRWWSEVFGRSDDEMNKPLSFRTPVTSFDGGTDEVGRGTALTSVQTASGEETPSPPRRTEPNGTGLNASVGVDQGLARMAAGFARVGIGGEAKVNPDPAHGQSTVNRELEVEMQ